MHRSLKVRTSATSMKTAAISTGASHPFVLPCSDSGFLLLKKFQQKASSGMEGLLELRELYETPRSDYPTVFLVRLEVWAPSMGP